MQNPQLEICEAVVADEAVVKRWQGATTPVAPVSHIPRSAGSRRSSYATVDLLHYALATIL